MARVGPFKWRYHHRRWRRPKLTKETGTLRRQSPCKNNGRLFLQHCGSNERAHIQFVYVSRCWDPDCCKHRYQGGTCSYSNLETKTLLQQSRDPNGIQIAVRAGFHPFTCVYSNLETCCYSNCCYSNVDPMDLYCCNSNMEPVHS